MESGLNNQNFILFRQLVKFCRPWIFCSKLSPSQEREAVAEFMHSSEITYTRRMRSWTTGFKRQRSTVGIICIWLWTAIPMLPLLNIFSSSPHGGMESTLSKCTDQTNTVSMWKETFSLLGVCEATVSGFTSPQNRNEIKKRDWGQWKATEVVGAGALAQLRQGWGNWARSAWKGDGSLANSSLARPLGDCREDGPRLFSEVHSEGMRGNRHKIHQGKLWQDGRKTISLWAWLSNGRGCPEKMSDLHRYTQN